MSVSRRRGLCRPDRSTRGIFVANGADMFQRWVGPPLIGVATVLLSCGIASGCAHHPGQAALRVPPPPTPKVETSDPQRAARRAENKVRDVVKQLEKGGRHGRKQTESEQPVGQ